MVIKRNKLAKLAYFLSIAISFTVLLCGYGKPHVAFFSQKVKLYYPAAICYRMGDTYIVDKECSRILCIDAKDRVTKILNVKDFYNSFNVITALRFDSKYIYILGYNTTNDGNFISKEHLEKYTLDGVYVTTLYEEKCEGEGRILPCLTDLDMIYGTIYVTRINSSRREISAFELRDGLRKLLNCESGHEAIFAQYDPVAEKLTFADQYNTVYVKTNNGLKVNTEKAEIFKGDSQKLVTSVNALRGLWNVGDSPISVKALREVPRYNSEGEMVYSSWIVEYRHAVIDYDYLNKTTCIKNEYKAIPKLLIEGTVYILCLFWCVLAFAIVVAKAIYKGFEHKTRLLIIAVITVLCICGFYTYGIRLIVAEQYNERIDMLCKAIERDNRKEYGDIFQTISKTGADNYLADEEHKDKTEAMSKHLTEVCQSFGAQDGFFADIFILNKDNELLSFVSSTKRYPIGYRCTPWVQKMYLDAMKLKQNYVRNSDSATSYISKYSPKFNVGGIKVFNVVGCSYDNIKRVAAEHTAGMFINLLVFFLAAFIAIRLLFIIIPNIKKIVSKDADERFSALTCPFSFLVFMCNGLEMLSFVIIAINMAQGDMLQATKVITVQTVGVAVGTVVSPMLSKVKDRTVALIAAILLVLSQILIIYSIVDINLWLFAGASALRGFSSQGLLASAASRIPFMIIDKNLQKQTLPSFYSGKMGGQIIGILFAGIMLSLLGYPSIYIAMTVIALFEIILIILIPDSNAANAARKATEFKKLGKAIATPTFVMFALFLAFPRFAAGGYLYKYFPMLAGGSKVSPLILSNVIILIKAANFVMHDHIMSFFENLKFTKERTELLMMVCISLVLMSCVLNAGVLWATFIALFASLLATSAVHNEMFFYAAQTRKYNLDNTDAVNMATTVGFVGELLTSAILWLVPLVGLSRAPYVFGFISLVLCFVYAIYYRFRGEEK